MRVIDIAAGKLIGKQSGGAIRRHRVCAASWRTLDRVGGELDCTKQARSWTVAGTGAD